MASSPEQVGLEQPRSVVTPSRLRLALVALASVFAVAPVLVGIARVHDSSYQPSFDHAVHELLVRDVGTDSPPLVGPSTTAGNMNHPGPLPFYVLSVPYRAFGSPSWGLLVGAGIVSALAIMLAVAVATRVGGTWIGLAVAVGAGAFLHAAGVSAALDFWNPSIAQYPFLLFLVAAWGVAAGSRWLLPLVAVAGSFVAQAHAGFLPMVGLVGLWAIASLVLGEWMNRRRRAPTRSVSPGSGGVRDGLAGPDGAAARDVDEAAGPSIGQRLSRWRVVAPITLLIVMGCWAAPFVQTRTVAEGNLPMLIRYGLSSDRVGVGFEVAAETMAHQLGGVPTWLGKPDADPGAPITALRSPLTGLAVPAGALVFAALVAFRRRSRMLASLVGTAVVAIVAGLFAGAGIEGEVFVHYVRWWWSISLIVCLSAVAAVVVEVQAQFIHRSASLPARRSSAVLPDAGSYSAVAPSASAPAVTPNAVTDGADRRSTALTRRAVVAPALLPVALVAAAMASTMSAIPDRPWFVHSDDAEMRAVTSQAVIAYRGRGPVQVDNDGTIEGVKLQTALQVQLERADIPVAVEDSTEARSTYGIVRTQRRRTALVIASTGEQIAALVNPDQYQALAVADRLNERDHIGLLLLLAKGPAVTPGEAVMRDDLLRRGTVRAVFLDLRWSGPN